MVAAFDMEMSQVQRNLRRGMRWIVMLGIVAVVAMFVLAAITGGR